MSALGLGGYFEQDDPDEESSDEDSDHQNSPRDQANDNNCVDQSDVAANNAPGRAGTSGDVAPGALHLQYSTRLLFSPALCIAVLRSCCA